MANFVRLPKDSNQALGLGQFAIDFLSGKLGAGPSQAVLDRTLKFHTDAVLCGLSALALQCNAPTVLRNEALDYRVSDPKKGAFVFGSNQQVWVEKAIVANCSAVREWDSNGTNFGYRPEHHHCAGEFGHNDFYPVVIAACQQLELDGRTALLAMVLLDEIRGRLAEVFSLKTYKIDHVVHGAIASATTYGALAGATAEQIEHAIGMFVAHSIPWRAIRAGKQLSDSKGASAAISTEIAITAMKRAMNGFIGPKDIFRNPEAMFRYFEPTTSGTERWKEQGDSPFDLILSHSGDDFAVMGMHFKLGLYEHQSAGALQAIIDMVSSHPEILAHDGENINRIEIVAYEPAFGIIGNPMKKDPKTRQSADHSMAYIVATLLRKAMESEFAKKPAGSPTDSIWQELMLLPHDYAVNEGAVMNQKSRAIMQKIDFSHGGPDYDAKYPDGIPTSVKVHLNSGEILDSGLVMYPAGHARNEDANLASILSHKFEKLADLALPDSQCKSEFISKLESLPSMDAFTLAGIFDMEIARREAID